VRVIDLTLSSETNKLKLSSILSHVEMQIKEIKENVYLPPSRSDALNQQTWSCAGFHSNIVVKKIRKQPWCTFQLLSQRYSQEDIFFDLLEHRTKV